MAEAESGGPVVRKPWDKRMKRLFYEAPQDYVDWLLPGAQFLDTLSTDLENETLQADLLFAILLKGERTLLHIEFQKKHDAQMAERLWSYNHKATLKYKCPVWSIAIYLKRDGSAARTPFRVDLSTGQSIHHFNFEVIKLWEIPVEELKQKGLRGLLPLLPLTRDGARREVIEESIGELTVPKNEPNAELLALTYGIASLALEDAADQEWLHRRFSTMFDLLYETRAFQELIEVGRKEGLEKGREEGREKGREEGLEEGLQKGLQKGLQEGKLEALRLAVLDVVRERFPKVTRFARKHLEAADDLDVLRRLLIKMSVAKTAEEAKLYLLELDEDEEEE